MKEDLKMISSEFPNLRWTSREWVELGTWVTEASVDNVRITIFKVTDGYEGFFNISDNDNNKSIIYKNLDTLLEHLKIRIKFYLDTLTKKLL